MNQMPLSLEISFIALLCILAGALLGGIVRKFLPKRYLDSETKDVVKLTVGLIATLTALVLGLLIATAKSAYEAKDSQIKQITANVVQLDFALAEFGQDATELRNMLRRAINPMADQIWIESRVAKAPATAFEALAEGKAFYSAMFQLTTRNESQRLLRDRALKLTGDLVQSRLVLFASIGSPIPLLFLIILISWIAILFTGFGVLLRANPVAISAVVLCAVVASGAFYLILDLGQPFSGLMAIPSEPLRNALIPLAQ
jgi:hypothetical protein